MTRGSNFSKMKITTILTSLLVVAVTALDSSAEVQEEFKFESEVNKVMEVLQSLTTR